MSFRVIILLCSCMTLILARAAPSSWSKIPEEHDHLFEGDILMSGAQKASMRNLVTRPESLWPNKTLVYELSDEYALVEKVWIRLALKSLQRSTCVRLVERTNEINYMLVRNFKGCASPVGYIPAGEVHMFLQLPTCIKWGTIQHEFLHALGFWHEHTRPDRDQFVKILWENIKNGKEVNFITRSIEEAQYEGMPYDFSSVMHYRTNAFSRNDDSPTIIPLRYGVKIGQRKKVSNIDIAKLNRLYDCGPEYYLGEDILGTTSQFSSDGTTQESGSTNSGTSQETSSGTTVNSNSIDTTQNSNIETTQDSNSGTSEETNPGTTLDSNLIDTTQNLNIETTQNSNSGTTLETNNGTTLDSNSSGTTLDSNTSETTQESNSDTTENIRPQENVIVKRQLPIRIRRQSYPEIDLRPPAPDPVPHYWHISPHDDKCPCQTERPKCHRSHHREHKKSSNKSSAEMYDNYDADEKNSDTGNATQYASSAIKS